MVLLRIDRIQSALSPNYRQWCKTPKKYQIILILAGGLLRSPATRNTAKYCIYIIILSILSAKELIFCIPQEASRCPAPYWHQKMTYIVRKCIFASCGRAVRAKQDFFSWIDFFCQDGSNEV